MDYKLINLGIALALALTITTLTLCPTAIAEEEPPLQWVWTWNVLIHNSPYGKLTACIEAYKVMNDGVPDHDWYCWFLTIQTVPGVKAFGSDWYTDKHFVVMQGGVLYENIINYGPTTTIGTIDQTTTFSIGVVISPTGGATLGYSTSITYSISEVAVYDHSDIDPMVDRLVWEHDMYDYGTSSGVSYKANPACIVMTDIPPCPNIPNGLDPFWARFNVTWCKEEVIYLGKTVIIRTLRRTFESPWQFWSVLQ